MHRPIFGRRNDEDASTRKKQKRNEEDADTGAPGSLTAPVEANYGGSSSSPLEIDNSASSSLAASTGNCYEVFLSFRGPDTRHGFTDHLYHGLLNAGIDVFRDDGELCQGQDIRPVLMEAITNSKILIPIFSESYGTSSWCLDELVEIMERKNNNGQIVLPIFYKVKPSDVGHQIGSFGDAFHERERRLLERDLTNLEKWKKALREVSTLKGYEAKGSEAELVNSVVRKVLSELKKKFELVVSENLVGIDSHVKNVMEFVENKSHATLFVGIHGMGGIGKTTLAKAIYNKLSNQFEHRSFIANIRESWKTGIHQLQKKLIGDILQQKIGVRDENEGTSIISSRLKGKMVLLVLDDVDNVDQVKCFAGNHDWFSRRSRIIITTRDKRIFKGAEVDYEYDLKEMDYAQSLILFSKHAFRMGSPPKDFEDLTREVVLITGGLPLCLEVFGSLFYGKESKEWRDTIDMLKKVPHTEVQERLRISYEALDYRQKQIFLDIACFFIDTDMRIASYMWKACDFFPMVNIEVLRLLSLIKIENDHELRMHDHLRDLGRTIVREKYEQRPWHHSRLWDSDEASKVLKTNKGTEEIEAINLSKSSSYGDIYTDKQFNKLKTLRFLHMMEGAHLCGDFKHSIEELKWLRWENCPMNFQVKNFHLTELVVLELSRSKINERWQGWSSFMMAEKLKFLNLSNCESLENMDFLSAFKNLEVLILNGCQKLQQMDSSIGDMKALLRLELSGCERLMELPVEIGKLKALKQLLLHSTQVLSALPESIASLENLEILDISRSGIKELPNDIGRLRQLRELSVNGCKNMKGEMPESIGSLENLEILDISKSGIKELPNSIGRLRKLGALSARYCVNLKGKMLESMRNLSSLQFFDVLGRKELQLLPDLPSSLTYLGVTCQSRILPSLSHLTRLKELMIRDCPFLECFPEFPPTLLKNLECSQLTDVEESKLPQSLTTPFNLETLEVNRCKSIEILDVSQLIHLRKLFTVVCKKLLEVRGLDRLEFLEDLTISYCDSLERPLLPKSRSLRILQVSACKNLAEIQGLDRLEFLENLNLTGCASIESLPILCCFDTLRTLTIDFCDKLQDIQSLERFPSCKSLCIENCKSLAKLPNLSSFHNLQKLLLSNCPELREILGLEESIFLKFIAILGCSSIEILPDLSSCTRLISLIVQNCEQLTELRGLEKLEQLVELDISGCKSLKTVPELSRTRLYQNYEKRPFDSGCGRIEFGFPDVD